MGKVALAESRHTCLIPRKPFEPSAQQAVFFNALVNDTSHIRLTARAGTGKSTSAREGMWRLIDVYPDIRCSYVAFNKAIANDFQNGLPDGTRATTMHSLGRSAIQKAVEKIGEPDQLKSHRLADQYFRSRDKVTRQAKMAISRLVGLCKNNLISEPSPNLLIKMAATFGIMIPAIHLTKVVAIIPKVLRASINTSVIDFDDMVWLPVVLGLDFPETDVLFVDEAQDLSPCQHAFVQQAASNGRLIAIGDERQAIYSFRGADSQSLDTLTRQLKSTFRGLVNLPLTFTRRCPKSHVAIAAGIVPDFSAFESNRGGRVDIDQTTEILEPGWMVLARTNAALVGAALKMAASGVPVAIQGRDFGDTLVQWIDGHEADTVTDLLLKLNQEVDQEILTLADIDGSEEAISLLRDKLACVSSVGQRAATPQDMINQVRRLFVDVSQACSTDYVLFSSIHRAKGREADKVALLEPQKLPHPMAKSPEAQLQEANLAYVAATRSKHRLSFLGPIPSLFDN